jgi:hypothetical protein
MPWQASTREKINMKMVLWNKLRSIEMTKSNSVTSYLMNVTQICDQLAIVGEKVANAKQVNMALNGYPASWEPFVKDICACEDLPNLERVWDDCIQDGIQMESKANKKGCDENLVLFGQTNKGIGKGPSKGKGKNKELASQLGRDLSKTKCLICHNHCHYASQCLQ